MLEYIEKIEKTIYAVLMLMLILVLIASMIDLAYLVYVALVIDTPILLQSHELTTILGAFLLVLIGVELLDTIKAYFRENTIHVEIVILLAIIAVARKVILLDPTSISAYEFGFEMIGIGVIVMGLAAGYYLIKKKGFTIGPDGLKSRE